MPNGISVFVHEDHSFNIISQNGRVPSRCLMFLIELGSLTGRKTGNNGIRIPVSAFEKPKP